MLCNICLHEYPAYDHTIVVLLYYVLAFLTCCDVQNQIGINTTFRLLFVNGK